MGSDSAAAPGTLAELIPSWRRHLRAANYSPRTIVSYISSAERFNDFLSSTGAPSKVEALSTRDVEAAPGLRHHACPSQYRPSTR
jgi:hypothetical protein